MTTHTEVIIKWKHLCFCATVSLATAEKKQQPLKILLKFFSQNINTVWHFGAFQKVARTQEYPTCGLNEPCLSVIMTVQHLSFCCHLWFYATKQRSPMPARKAPGLDAFVSFYVVSNKTTLLASSVSVSTCNIGFLWVKNFRSGNRCKMFIHPHAELVALWLSAQWYYQDIWSALCRCQPFLEPSRGS